MNYTNKQINRIINIKELITISNTLSKLYKEYDDKELIIETLNEKEIIYKVYCSSIYNVMDAIKQSEDLFGVCEEYHAFESVINREYYANNDMYYSNTSHKSDFYKIMKTIRDQVNHFTRDDEDNNMLFEINIDFNIIENLRVLINNIVDTIYNRIDKERIKNIILNKPRIKYSLDKVSNKMDELNLRIPENENVLKKEYKDYNNLAFEIFDKTFNNENLYDILTKEPEAINRLIADSKKLDDATNELEKYINTNGTDYEKEVYKLLKGFINEKGVDSFNNLKNNVEELQSRLSKLNEKYNMKIKD